MELNVSLSAPAKYPLPDGVVASIKKRAGPKVKVRASKGSVTLTVEGQGTSVISGTEKGHFSVNRTKGNLSDVQEFDNVKDAVTFACGAKTTRSSNVSSKSKGLAVFDPLIPVLTAAGVSGIESKVTKQKDLVLYCSKGDWDFVITPGSSGDVKYVVYASNSEDEELDYKCSTVERVVDAINLSGLRVKRLEPGVYFAAEGTVFESSGNPAEVLAKTTGVKSLYLLRSEDSGPSYFFTKKPTVVRTEGYDLAQGVMFDVKKPGKIVIVLDD